MRNRLEVVIAWRMPSGWSATGSGTYCSKTVGTMDGHYKVKNVAAWWPQGSNRSATAAYHIAHSGGTTVVTVNQQANGGKWNSLGNFNFAGGNTTVQLSCWTTTGYVVVADAIR